MAIGSNASVVGGVTDPAQPANTTATTTEPVIDLTRKGASKCAILGTDCRASAPVLRRYDHYMEFTPTELVGYLGSVLIIVSLTRTSILHLRLVGLAGSASFLVYSILIEAYPIAVVNVVIIGVHLYFLRQLLSKKVEFFTSLELNKDSQYLRHFLEFHRDDIETHQPGFRFEARDDQLRAFILRDTVPAGVFIGRTCGDDTIEIELDYVAPQYRDFKVANYLYSDRSELFASRGRRRIWTRPGSATHVAYFTRLGFTPVEMDDGPALMADLDAVLTTNA